MKMLIWNYNGTASKPFHRPVKDLIQNHKLVLLGLVETKIRGALANKVCRNLGFDYRVRVEAMGFSGGIWVFWKDDLLADIVKTHPQFVHMKIYAQGKPPRLISVIYGSPTPSLRKSL